MKYANSTKWIRFRERKILYFLVLTNAVLLFYIFLYNKSQNTQAATQTARFSELQSDIHSDINIQRLYVDLGSELAHGSWKLPPSQFKKIPMLSEKLQVPKADLLPRKHNGKIISLYNEYTIMVPISSTDSIEWFRNYYSDVNIRIVCDASDMREGCDMKLRRNYEYETLSSKTRDMFGALCTYVKEKENGNFSKYKFVGKMDMDTILHKPYLFTLVKHFADNKDQRMFAGPLGVGDGFIGVVGHFYAINQITFIDYCTCKIPEPHIPNEDFWFSMVLRNCVKSKFDFRRNRMVYYQVDDDSVRHKRWKEDGVDIKIGVRNMENAD